MLDDSKILHEFRIALSHHQTGEFEKAKQLYKKILKSTPSHFDSTNMLGVLHVQEGDFRKGMKYLNDAIRLNPDAAIAYFNKSEAFTLQKDYGSALDGFKKSLEINPNYYEAAYKIGLTQHYMNRYEEAVQSFKDAIRIGPNNFIAYHSMADSLRELDRNEDAIRVYGQAIERNPQSALSYNNRGIAYKKITKFEQCESDYKKAISLDPANSIFHYNLGNLYKDTENYPRAIEFYKTALKFNPNFKESLFNMGLCLHKLEQWKAASEIYSGYIHLFETDYDAHKNYAQTLIELGFLKDALEHANKAITLKSDHAELYTVRAHILNSMGEYELSIRDCNKAIELKPEFSEAFSNRALNFYDLEEFEKAQADFNKANSLEIDYTNSLYNESLLMIRLKNSSNGFENYKYRWKRSELKWRPLKTDIDHWIYNSKPEKLLLWAEQGIGDEIFYASLLSLISKDIKITLCSDKRLHPIYERSFPHITLHDRLDQDRLGREDFDAQSAIGDIAAALKVDIGKINERAYPFLITDQIKSEDLRRRLHVLDSQLLCGISWKSKNRKIGSEKSLALKDLVPLLKMPGLSFVNLQYGDVAQEIKETETESGIEFKQIEELDIYNDINGLLSLISACDVVVTTSNVTAHLAGAIGKKAIVIVPSGKGHIWYWHDDPISLWYPSLRLVFRKAGISWDETMASILTTFKEIT